MYLFICRDKENPTDEQEYSNDNNNNGGSPELLEWILLQWGLDLSQYVD